MPIITNLEDKILQLIRSNQYQWFTVGINLGGVPGEGGGSGIPIGGFTGQLIQSRVTYDTTEAESMFVPSSGQSLVHNLNRIRSRINNLETYPGTTLVVQDDGSQVASGVVYLNFISGATLVSPTSDTVNITIVGGGGGSTLGGVTVAFEDVTSQIPGPANFYVLSQPVSSGSLQIYVNGLVQRPSYYTEVSSGFTTSETLVSTDELVAEFLTEVAATGLSVYDTGVIVGSGITELDFEGASVTASGVRATISGIGGGGGGASLLDELTDVTITSVADDEVLAYDSGGNWINQTPAEAGLSEVGHAHTEIDITDLEHNAIKIQGRTVSGIAPSIGDAYRWNGSLWVPSGIVGGGSHALGSATHTDVSVGGASQGEVLTFDNVNWIASGISAGDTDTKQVKVSSNDTTEGYLEDKIVAGSNVTITTLNEGGNETVEITSTGSGGGGSALTVFDEGITLSSGVTSLDFVGAGVVATNVGNAITVTVASGGGGGGVTVLEVQVYS